MREGMGGGAVQRHLGADPDADHHIADLADDVIGQQAAAVVFQDRVDHAVERHGGAQPDQYLGPGIGADKHVDRGFRGKGAEENGPGHRRFRIGVGEPGVERRHRGIEDEGNQDQRVGKPAAVLQGAEQVGAGFHAVQDDPAEQQHAAGDMNHEIAHARPHRRSLTGREDQIGGREGHDLPRHQQGEPVTGEDHAKGGPDIKKGGDMLGGPVDMQAIDATDEGHNGEHPGEHQAEFVDLADQQWHAEELEAAEFPRGHGGHGGDRRHGNHQQPDLKQPPLEQRQDQRPDHEHQRRVDPVSHNNPRPA